MNWVSLLAIVTSVVTTASIIARMTPDTHDDELVDKALKFIQWLSINGQPKQ